jgi:hypothetical protein
LNLQTAMTMVTANDLFYKKPKQGNKYGHLTWKESRPENTELRHRNEAAREAAKKAQE